MLTITLTVLIVLALSAARADRVPDVVQTAHSAQPAKTLGLYRGKPSSYWAFQYRERTRQLQQARQALHRRWAPTVDYAFRLASAVFGVSYWQLRSVAWCESRHYPYAENGRYKGLFQLSWSPFGFSPFDPVASALSTAATVSREGWSQWACKP